MVATESHCVEIDGEPIVVTANQTRVRSNHPLVKANPGYFRSADDSATYEDEDVEQATAAPGERRGRHPRTPAP
jgi:hypothetical protein